MQIQCELGGRSNVRAFRANDNVLILVEGELPNPGYDVEIEQSPLRIFPPQFNLIRCQRPGIFPEHVVPFKYSQTVRYPADQSEITVHHAEGTDLVQIEECGPQLAPYVKATAADADGGCPAGADLATGFSKKLSFDEAFAEALAKLPSVTPAHPDALETVRVVEVGGLFGGIAGFRDLYVRVCRTYD
jgi:hypothetical protein